MVMVVTQSLKINKPVNVHAFNGRVSGNLH